MGDPQNRIRKKEGDTLKGKGKGIDGEYTKFRANCRGGVRRWQGGLGFERVYLCLP